MFSTTDEDSPWRPSRAAAALDPDRQLRSPRFESSSRSRIVRLYKEMND